MNNWLTTVSVTNTECLKQIHSIEDVFVFVCTQVVAIYILNKIKEMKKSTSSNNVYLN